MKIKKMSATDNAIEFEASETNSIFLNAIRRVIATRVKTLAATKIDVTKNDSALYDEMLAHRIGLIPLSFDEKALKDENYSCKLVLQKKGPCTVYSGDFTSTDKNVKAVSSKIIITKLLESQELDLEATATFGTQGEHARWQPAIFALKPAEDAKKQDKFVVRIETVSGLKPEQIVHQALDVLEEDVKELAAEIK